MEIQKQFNIIGKLKKLHEEDNKQIENFSSSIYCYKNGNIFLVTDSITYKNLRQKQFFESVPIHKFVELPHFTERKIEDPFFLVRLDGLEKELIQGPYEGDYVVKGKTPEGWTIQAEVDFTVSFQRNGIQDEENIERFFIRLRNLSVDYHPHFVKGKKLEVSYGLSNLEVLYNFSTPFLDAKYELSLTSLGSRGSRDSENLSAEMILRVIDKHNSEELPYDNYFVWFELLLSFATGKCLKEIYRVEAYQAEGKQKKIELWTGSQIFRKGSGIAVIQQPYLHLFIQQSASKVTWENFSDKGLGSALRWYTEAFSSDAVSVEFILLCTVLETLNKHHSTEISSRLLPKPTYKEIRKQILNVLDEYERDLNREKIISQYQIFRKKVEKSFAEGSFNQIGSLRTSLKLMLEFYKTPYEDLFPNLEFIAIRDSIVHAGFGGDNIFSDLRKLGNLVVRLVLSILQYQGDYIESRRIEISGLVDFENHGLAYKTFPFGKDH